MVGELKKENCKERVAFLLFSSFREGRLFYYLHTNYDDAQKYCCRRPCVWRRGRSREKELAFIYVLRANWLLATWHLKRGWRRAHGSAEWEQGSDDFMKYVPTDLLCPLPFDSDLRLFTWIRGLRDKCGMHDWLGKNLGSTGQVPVIK